MTERRGLGTATAHLKTQDSDKEARKAAVSGHELGPEGPDPKSHVNLRDIGEVEPETLRPGVVFRSSQLVGSELLKKLGLKAILDLRGVGNTCKQVERELQQEKAVRRRGLTKQRLRSKLKSGATGGENATMQPCPFCTATLDEKHNLQLPVYHADFVPLRTGLRILKAVPRRTAALALLRELCCLGAEKVMAPAVADEDQLGLAKLYIILLDSSSQQMGRALRLFADSEQLPVLVHCTHGKDRTGLLVMLLLLLAGVPVQKVAAEYARSEGELVQSKEDGNLPLNDHLQRDTMLSSSSGTIEQAYQHLQQRYGGAYSYCRQAAGLTVQEIACIRCNLLQKPTGEDLAVAHKNEC